jgi:hypothetical protein
MRRALELRPGPCAWEAGARYGLAVLGIVSVMLAPTDWTWKGIALAALAVVWRLGAEPSADAGRPKLTLFPDGTATLARNGREQPAELTGRAWLSRVFCVLEVQPLDAEGAEWLRICASNQPPRAYRRLLGVLRLRALAAREDCLD